MASEEPVMNDKAKNEDRTNDPAYKNSVSIVNFFRNLRDKMSIVFLTYVKLVWIICLFIIVYHILLKPIYKLLRMTFIGETLNYTFGEKAAILPNGFCNRLLWLIEPTPVLIGSSILFTLISCIMIFAYILFLIALFIYGLPIIGAMIGNPREWEDFKRLKDVFDLFERKISPDKFIKICIYESIVVIFFGNKRESFRDYYAPKSIKSIIEDSQYLSSELDKNYYSLTKNFHEKKDYYNIESIKSLNHSIEANAINNTIITAYKEDYNKNIARNKYANNGFEESIRNVIPV